MDTSSYMELFFEESKEHLLAIGQCLLALEQSGSDLNVLNKLFRSAHTLKGMAGAMGFENMAHMTHEMENALDLMRSAKLFVTADVMDLLFQCVDLLEEMLRQIGESGTDSSVSAQHQLSKLQALVSGAAVPLEEPQAARAAMNYAQIDPASLDQYETTILQQAIQMGLAAYLVEVRL
ncbi:MAG: chemotaxis protein CheA, partial [Bacilli bacterium]|nr:chemotaxis protein CheA [Bacilli bacterium]